MKRRRGVGVAGEVSRQVSCCAYDIDGAAFHRNNSDAWYSFNRTTLYSFPTCELFFPTVSRERDEVLASAA